MNLRKIVLFPFSCLYGLGIALWKSLYRQGIYKSGKVSVPVLSVGNVTVGGNGKTPLVIALANLLESGGHRVGILSRGYGRKKTSDTEILVFSGKDRQLASGDRVPDPKITGDEPALLSARLPSATISLSSDRLAGARALLPFSPSVILMDDGFQSLEIFQDLSLVLISESDFRKILDCGGWGLGDLLPGGDFREGEDALLRSSAVVVTLEKDLTRNETEGLRHRFGIYFKRRFPGKGRLPVLFQKMVVSGLSCQTENEAQHDRSEKVLDPGTLKGRKIVLVSGIARPERFLKTVSGYGGIVLGHLVWSDHASWNPRREGEILSFLESVSQKELPEMILTTEKDFVKWPKTIRLPYTVCSVQIESCLLEPDNWEKVLAPILKTSSFPADGESL